MNAAEALVQALVAEGVEEVTTVTYDDCGE